MRDKSRFLCGGRPCCKELVGKISIILVPNNVQTSCRFTQLARDLVKHGKFGSDIRLADKMSINF